MEGRKEENRNKKAINILNNMRNDACETYMKTKKFMQKGIIY